MMKRNEMESGKKGYEPLCAYIKTAECRHNVHVNVKWIGFCACIQILRQYCPCQRMKLQNSFLTLWTRRALNSQRTQINWNLWYIWCGIEHCFIFLISRFALFQIRPEQSRRQTYVDKIRSQIKQKKNERVTGKRKTKKRECLKPKKYFRKRKRE